MMLMKGSGLFTIAFLVYGIWVLIASGNDERISRACRPVEWGGTIVASLTDIVLPEYSFKVDDWTSSIVFSCEYTVWRLFFEDAYLEQQNSTITSVRQDESADNDEIVL